MPQRDRSAAAEPVIIQAGASDTGRDFAAEVAEVVFGSSATLGKAIEFHSDLKEPMSKFGRQTDDLKVASGISVVIGESKQEARDKLESWQDLIHPDVGVMRLGQDLEADLSDLPIWNGGPYLAVLATTFSVAFSTTALCLVLGYPLAYWLCRKPPRQQRIATLERSRSRSTESSSGPGTRETPRRRAGYARATPRAASDPITTVMAAVAKPMPKERIIAPSQSGDAANCLPSVLARDSCNHSRN